MSSASLLASPDTTRRINDFLAESVDQPNRDSSIAFFCECGRANCYRPVWLTLVEYRKQRRENGWQVLAYGH